MTANENAIIIFYFIRGITRMMWKKLTTVALASILALGLAACSADESEGKVESATSNYPDSNITIVAPSGAGGGWDLTARAIAKTMSETKLIDKSITLKTNLAAVVLYTWQNLQQKK